VPRSWHKDSHRTSPPSTTNTSRLPGHTAACRPPHELRQAPCRLHICQQCRPPRGAGLQQWPHLSHPGQEGAQPRGALLQPAHSSCQVSCQACIGGLEQRRQLLQQLPAGAGMTTQEVSLHLSKRTAVFEAADGCRSMCEAIGQVALTWPSRLLQGRGLLCLVLAPAAMLQLWPARSCRWWCSTSWLPLLCMPAAGRGWVHTLLRWTHLVPCCAALQWALPPAPPTRCAGAGDCPRPPLLARLPAGPVQNPALAEVQPVADSNGSRLRSGRSAAASTSASIAAQLLCAGICSCLYTAWAWATSEPQKKLNLCEGV
jgi:hypothetical protein